MLDDIVEVSSSSGGEELEDQLNDERGSVIRADVELARRLQDNELRLFASAGEHSASTAIASAGFRHSMSMFDWMHQAEEREAQLRNDALLAARLQEKEAEQASSWSNFQISDATKAQIQQDAELARFLQSNSESGVAATQCLSNTSSLSLMQNSGRTSPADKIRSISTNSSNVCSGGNASTSCINTSSNGAASHDTKRRRLATLDQVSLQGKCRCGKLSFRLTVAAPVRLSRCHCQLCRRAHGAPWATSVLPEPSRATSSGRIDQVREQLRQQGLRQAPPWYCEGRGLSVLRSFCEDCGSTLLLSAGGQILLPAGALAGVARGPFHQPVLQELTHLSAPFYGGTLPPCESPQQNPGEGQGTCSCGRVRFVVRMPQQLDLFHCHCKTCQRWSGGDLQSWVALSRCDVTWKTLESFCVVQSSKNARRGHCGVCGTALGMEYDDQPGTVFLAAGVFEDASFARYSGKRHMHHHHIYRRFAPPWSSPARLL